MTEFHLVDLVSQREAVRQHLRNYSQEQIVAWLAARGTLTARLIQGQKVFTFTSVIGVEASFFFDGDDFTFLGDHYTFK